MSTKSKRIIKTLNAKAMIESKQYEQEINSANLIVVFLTALIALISTL